MVYGGKSMKVNVKKMMKKNSAWRILSRSCVESPEKIFAMLCTGSTLGPTEQN